MGGWAVSFLLAASAAACGGSSNPPGLSSPDGSTGDDATGDGSLGDDAPSFDLGTVDPDAETLQIAPLSPTIDVDAAAPTKTTQAFTATLAGRTVGAVWSIDRGEIGSIDATGLFTPSGTVGGAVKVTASYGSKTATTTLTVHLHAVAIGGGTASGGDAGVGSGGYGGVGGEGLGAAPPSAVVSAFGGTPTADPSLTLIYPYDQTVWPRGILAPLLQWRASGDFDAVQIHLKETAYEFTGTYAKTATPFIHHPIPQDVWSTLAYSNAGEPVTVTLTFVRGSTLYGPITTTWKIASGALPGTIYYQSYGTNLTHYNITSITGARFGAATLAIKGGATSPTLVSGTDSQCRVCHSVSADGSMLVTQTGENYSQSVALVLGGGASETTLGPGDGRFEFGGLRPDGKSIVTGQNSNAGTLGLYATGGATTIATSGLPSDLVPGTPSWSPDGKHVAFNCKAGTGCDGVSLGSVDFDGTSVFSGFAALYKPTAGTAVWPSWLPTSDALVFELETVNNGRDYAGTRSTCDDTGSCSDTGTRGELWWYDVASKTAARLDNANGLGMVPKGDSTTGSNHDDDASLQYEPTVNPVVSGGYAWVVFTSRRLYGNVATVNPYWSDPRFHDISSTPTTKKLWVAAIDLSRTPGKDASHPAFYLPGQELLAGNSRGFWVVDPCKKDGSSCLTGDECCNGYCETPPGAEAGAGRVCTMSAPTCSAEYDKCTKDTDCCGAPALKCIGGRCGTPGPS